MASQLDLLLVIGDPTSSNSNRLRELGESHGVESHLILNESEIDATWFEGKDCVGITSGASTPEISVQGVLNRLRELGSEDVHLSSGPTEEMFFAMPEALR